MTALKPGWKREPVWNCPLCKGKGRVFWQHYNDVNPSDWMCVGRRKPKPPKKKGPLMMAETALSKKRRQIWMEQAHYETDCPCTTMKTLNYDLLKNAAKQMQRIKHNQKPRRVLDDPLDDLFPGPYPFPEFLK